jgi:hypothetical protein
VFLVIALLLPLTIRLNGWMRDGLLRLFGAPGRVAASAAE